MEQTAQHSAQIRKARRAYYIPAYPQIQADLDYTWLLDLLTRSPRSKISDLATLE